MFGQTSHNRYQVTSTLGKGAMGVVYRARDRQTQLEVALKVMSADLAPEADNVERFRREGEALQTLRHRNIVAFVDMFDYQGHQVIVMEYVPGGNLRRLIAQGALPPGRAREIALDLCDALTSAHRLNIIHRDIKPENVLLAGDGTPKLTDFGLARLVSEKTRLTGSGMLMGTPDYMSPEAWEGRPLDEQADIWSLGVVLYEMLAGELPFGGDTIATVMNRVLTAPVPDVRTLRPEVAPPMAAIVRRMLRREPLERYRTMRQVGVDLEALEHDASQVQPEVRGEGDEATRITAPFMNSEALPATVTPLGAAGTPNASATVPIWPGGDLKAEPQPTTLVAASATAGAPQEEADKPATAALGISKRTWVLGGAAALVVICLLLAGVYSWWVAAGKLLAPAATSSPTAPFTTKAPQATAAQPLSRASAPATIAASLTGKPLRARTPTAAPPNATPVASAIAASTSPQPPTAASTPDLGIGSTMVSPKDGMTLMYVPAGPFLMGSTDADADAQSSEKPQHKVTLDSYWIDKTDVTNAMFAKFVQAKGYKTDAENGTAFATIYDPNSLKWVDSTNATWKQPQRPGTSIQGPDYPVVQVSWNDADKYCAWDGRKLPTEAQWEKAARGTDGREFPWGNQAPVATLLNFGRPRGGMTPVGNYPLGASPYGALDMAGNVSQWVADLFEPTYYKTSPADNPLGPTISINPNNLRGPTGVLRGGSWYMPAAYARSASRVSNVRLRVSSESGFRCAFVP